MILNNALIEGKLQSVCIENGKITCISDEPISGGTDLCGNRLIPGLIDVHTHGCNGYEAMDADFEPMCRYYAEHGTTSFLPTTMTQGIDSIRKVTEAETRFNGAIILGFHLEGPYISVKYKGAQNEKYIKAPSVDEFKSFTNVKIINIAPELSGSLDFINEVSKECIVALGHTDCDYETALAAINNGANCLTHTYNAMPPLHHRNPGPIGAAFEKQIYAQIICDGFHISKPVILATYKMFGAEKMILISDSLQSAGLPDGEYISGGLEVTVKNGTARLHDGTIAGSNVMLWDCVKKAMEFGIPFDDAVRMASKTPAEMLEISKGQIKVGFDADLLVIDDNLDIKTVIIGGEIFS